MTALESRLVPQKLSWRRRGGLFALSIFWAASVYLYLGYPRRALAVVLINCMLVAVVVFGPSPLAEWSGAPSLIAVWVVLLVILPILDLVGLARRGRARAGQYYQRWWVYIGFVLLNSILGTTYVELRKHDLVGLRVFYIPSRSMEPNLLEGDYLFSVMNAWRSRPIQRGDIVFFKISGAFYTKRVIALPGDKIAFADGRVILNDKPLERVDLGPWTGHNHDSSGAVRQGTLYRETLPDGRSYTVSG